MNRNEVKVILNGPSGFIAVLGVLVLSLLPTRSWADEYPSRTIKVVVPLEAGGGTDLLARIIGEKLSEYLHQLVIVDNRPGAGTQIGAEIVARAAPDGYTLLSSSLTTYAFNPSLYKKLPYDPAKDFAPISLTGRFAFLLVAKTSRPICRAKRGNGAM
jgi:tripartite-type tricarboxylate transporter receptor subunit TctC